MAHMKAPQVRIQLKTAAEVKNLFLRMGYNVPTWYALHLRRTAALEFKKPDEQRKGMEYHVRVDKEGDAYLAESHYEPSQSANPAAHARMYLTRTEADYMKGRDRLLLDLRKHAAKGLYSVIKY
ncbi:MAG: hypothetical protein JXR37_29700 [Kiritimatiellae bacterium]|nr:hypothetical protein [Kiritimatiellia bacterium]